MTPRDRIAELEAELAETGRERDEATIRASNANGLASAAHAYAAAVREALERIRLRAKRDSHRPGCVCEQCWIVAKADHALSGTAGREVAERLKLLGVLESAARRMLGSVPGWHERLRKAIAGIDEHARKVAQGAG